MHILTVGLLPVYTYIEQHYETTSCFVEKHNIKLLK